jgi:murein L,D-transpeptidase YafK
MMEPLIIIRKAERRLELHVGDGTVKAFPVIVGFSPEGDKAIEGDGKTPEGEFYIFTKNEKSAFHLSLALSYPRIEDAERGLATGLIVREEYDEIVSAISNRKKPPQKTKLGGEIYIHGGGIERGTTRGCIGMDDEHVQEIFDSIPVGAIVKITA